MSLRYYLYNATEPAPKNEWDSDHSLPIATAQEVQDRIMKLYPHCDCWEKHESTQTPPNDYPVTYFALGNDNCSANSEYLDLALMQNSDGTIHFISARSASPKLVRELCEEFNLPYFFEL